MNPDKELFEKNGIITVIRILKFYLKICFNKNIWRYFLYKILPTIFWKNILCPKVCKAPKRPVLEDFKQIVIKYWHI